MTFCPDCEEWVEVDERRCPLCNQLLSKKKKKKEVDYDMDEEEIVTLSDDDDFPMGRRGRNAVSDSEG
jgi:hypothetical protein